jgi:protein tyrosine phosphatase
MPFKIRRTDIHNNPFVHYFLILDDFSRVILPKNNSNLTKNKEGYINANYIKSIEKNNNNKMILTQGPV